MGAGEEEVQKEKGVPPPTSIWSGEGRGHLALVVVGKKSSSRKGSKASVDPTQCPHRPGRCSRARGR